MTKLLLLGIAVLGGLLPLWGGVLGLGARPQDLGGARNRSHALIQRDGECPEELSVPCGAPKCCKPGQDCVNGGCKCDLDRCKARCDKNNKREKPCCRGRDELCKCCKPDWECAEQGCRKACNNNNDCDADACESCVDKECVAACPPSRCNEGTCAAPCNQDECSFNCDGKCNLDTNECDSGCPGTCGESGICHVTCDPQACTAQCGTCGTSGCQTTTCPPCSSCDAQSGTCKSSCSSTQVCDGGQCKCTEELCQQGEGKCQTCSGTVCVEKTCSGAGIECDPQDGQCRCTETACASYCMGAPDKFCCTVDRKECICCPTDKYCKAEGRDVSRGNSSSVERAGVCTPICDKTQCDNACGSCDPTLGCVSTTCPTGLYCNGGGPNGCICSKQSCTGKCDSSKEETPCCSNDGKTCTCCPKGQSCQDGTCKVVDPCQGVNCGDCSTCDPKTGSCQNTCSSTQVCIAGHCECKEPLCREKEGKCRTCSATLLVCVDKTCSKAGTVCDPTDSVCRCTDSACGANCSGKPGLGKPCCTTDWKDCICCPTGQYCAAGAADRDAALWGNSSGVGVERAGICTAICDKTECGKACGSCDPTLGCVSPNCPSGTHCNGEGKCKCDKSSSKPVNCEFCVEDECITVCPPKQCKNGTCSSPCKQSECGLICDGTCNTNTNECVSGCPGTCTDNVCQAGWGWRE